MKKRYLSIFAIVLGLLSFFIAYYWPSPTLVVDRTSHYGESEFPNHIEQLEEDIPPQTNTTSATILAAGDIMFHMPQLKAYYDKEDGTYNFDDVFKYVKKHIDSADLSIANFETVTAGNDMGFSGFPRFNSPTEVLSAIKFAGFDVLTTANNHALDQGKKGLINTIESIEKVGMKNIGTYKEQKESIFIEEVNGIRIALLSYSYGFNGLDYTLSKEEFSFMVSMLDESVIKSDIEQANELEADIIVVLIHWGNEYQDEPSEYQIELGKKMVEWGANIIFGSHPHVVQRSEIIHHDEKDNFIIYSLGNFLSNQSVESIGNKYTEDGLMVKITLTKDLLTGSIKIEDISYIPTWVRRYSNQGLKYEILPIKDFLNQEYLYSAIGESERKRIRDSYNDTLNKMIKN